MDNPVSGAAYLLRGFRLIASDGLRRFALIPIGVSALLFAALVGLGIHYFDILLSTFLPTADTWWASALRVVLWPLFAFAVGIVMLFGFSVLTNLVAAPFNALLAEHVEARLGGQVAETTFQDALREFLPSLLREIQKLGYALMWAVPVLIVTLIPPLTLISPFLWGLYAAWMLALEYGAYPMDNHHIRFPDARARIAKHRFVALGFGGAVAAALLVPIVNLFVMPAAVAGATAFWVERLVDHR